MDFPADIRFKLTVTGGSVLYFTEESINSDQPHYFVVLNYDPRRGFLLVLVNATTLSIDVASRANRVPMETLVDVNEEQCPFLKKPSLFDCNRAIEKSVDALIEKLDQGQLKICGNVSPEVLSRLRLGVIASKQVPPATKNKLKRH